MKKNAVIKETADFVRKTLEKDSTGHDWWHIYRVWRMAKSIAKHENANIYVVELGALLHDIADWKFHNGNTSQGPMVARNWLEKFDITEEIINHVCNIIELSNFMGGGVRSEMSTIEGKIVQDADRLDSIGAIGISRTFAYGGYAGRAIYDPNEKPQLHISFDQYKKSKSSSINHFYEKLLLLKDLMNTNTAKLIAKRRHEFMEEFLEHFFAEWEGKE